MWERGRRKDEGKIQKTQSLSGGGVREGGKKDEEKHSYSAEFFALRMAEGLGVEKNPDTKTRPNCIFRVWMGEGGKK